VIAPALVTLAANVIWTGEFDEGERWVQRAVQALQTDTGPGIRVLASTGDRRGVAGRPD
jgi:LuxR family maltose regulon positive regulatory protein